MKPDWDKLMEAFKGSNTALIADVDCTGKGKGLCDKMQVRGYPTIKYGDPNNLEDYKGGRDFNALKKFADEKLGPSCGPKHIDLCDAETKDQILKFQAMSSDDLAATIKEQNAVIDKMEADFKSTVDGLQEQYDIAAKKKDSGIEEVKATGLGLMKTVQGYKKSATKGEEL